MESYYGYIATPLDAALIIAAAFQKSNLVAPVSCRLDEHERNKIRSGSVFTFSENESGMKRWTDGIRWTKSRVEGQFLTYRRLSDSAESPSSSDSSGNSKSGPVRRLAHGHQKFSPLTCDPNIDQSGLTRPYSPVSADGDVNCEEKTNDFNILCKRTFALQVGDNTYHVVF